MKIKRVEVTAEDINTETVQVIDPKISITTTSASGLTETKTYYPIDFQIVNDCGAGVEFNIITSLTDYNEYLADSTYYGFQRVPKTAIVQSDHTNIPRCYRLLIKGYDIATYQAETPLIIEFINYQPYNY